MYLNTVTIREHFLHFISEHFPLFIYIIKLQVTQATEVGAINNLHHLKNVIKPNCMMKCNESVFFFVNSYILFELQDGHLDLQEIVTRG